MLSIKIKTKATSEILTIKIVKHFAKTSVFGLMGFLRHKTFQAQYNISQRTIFFF